MAGSANRMSRSVVVGLLVVFAALAAACSTSSDDPAVGSPELLQLLTAQQWDLDPQDSSVSSPEAASTTLIVESDETVNGSGPCNSYGGNLVIDGETIWIEDLFQTFRACEQPVMEAERQYMEALQAVRQVDTANADRLVLTGDGGVRLSYVAQDLTSTIIGVWDVVNLAMGSGIQSVVADTELTITFKSDGTLEAYAGCGTMEADWALDGSSLTVTSFFPGSVTCDMSEEMTRQQDALARAVQEASQVEISGDMLTLLDADGLILVVANRQTAG